MQRRERGARRIAAVACGLVLLVGLPACSGEQAPEGPQVTPLGGQGSAGQAERKKARPAADTPPSAIARGPVTGRAGGGVAVRPSAVDIPTGTATGVGGGGARTADGDDDWVWQPAGGVRSGGGGGRPRPPRLDIEACDRYGRVACNCKDPLRGEAACRGAVEVLRTWKRMLDMPSEDDLRPTERARGGARGLGPAREAVRAEAERACREALREARKLCRGSVTTRD